MTSPEQTEAAEAQADQLEQDWLNQQGYLSLVEALAADGPDIGQTEEARQAWRIDGDNTAVWALRKLAAQEAEIERIRRTAQAEIERVQAWALTAENGPARAADFFRSKLIDYRRRLEADNPALPKTYRTPAGDIAVRAGRTSVKVIDESQFVDWAVDHKPSALTYKPKVTGLKDFPRSGEQIIDPETGEAVPGVASHTADPTYSVKPSTEPEPF